MFLLTTIYLVRKRYSIDEFCRKLSRRKIYVGVIVKSTYKETQSMKENHRTIRKPKLRGDDERTTNQSFRVRIPAIHVDIYLSSEIIFVAIV